MLCFAVVHSLQFTDLLWLCAMVLCGFCDNFAVRSHEHAECDERNETQSGKGGAKVSQLGSGARLSITPQLQHYRKMELMAAFTKKQRVGEDHTVCLQKLRPSFTATTSCIFHRCYDVMFLRKAPVLRPMSYSLLSLSLSLFLFQSSPHVNDDTPSSPLI